MLVQINYTNNKIIKYNLRYDKVTYDIELCISISIQIYLHYVYNY